MFALGRLLDLALRAAGHTPDVYAGHSLGEWTGMVVSELVPPAAAAAFVGGLRPGSLEVPDVVFAAVGCSAAGAAAALAGLADVAVSHDNCRTRFFRYCASSGRLTIPVMARSITLPWL